MDWSAFYINGQVISFISLAIMSAFIFVGLIQRKRAGYATPAWLPQIYIFLGLDALLSVFLVGFQMADTPFFYPLRRLFSLPSLLFVFLAALDFPSDRSIGKFVRIRKAVIVFMLAQIFFNAGWLVFVLLNPARIGTFAWLSTIRNVLLPVSFVLLAALTQFRVRVLKREGETEVAAILSRFNWFFGAGILFSIIVFFRGQALLPAGIHITASSYGWMIVCAGTALTFLSFGRREGLLAQYVTVLVLLVFLLALGATAEILSISLGKTTSLIEMDTLLRPFVFIQGGIFMLTVLLLPRWLRNIIPLHADSQLNTIPMTSRQREVMHYLASEKSNQQIALEMHITVATAKHHVAMLMKKYSAASRYQLGQIARSMAEKNEL